MTDKEKQIEELLEKATGECLRGCTICETKDILIKEAIEILKQCPTCEGSKKVKIPNFGTSVDFRKDCPDCTDSQEPTVFIVTENHQNSSNVTSVFSKEILAEAAAGKNEGDALYGCNVTEWLVQDSPSNQPLSCPKCTKSFPAYMQNVFDGHVANCKNPPPDEPTAKDIDNLTKDLEQVLQENPNWEKLEGGKWRKCKPDSQEPADHKPEKASEFVKECYELIPTTQHIGYLKRTLYFACNRLKAEMKRAEKYKKGIDTLHEALGKANVEYLDLRHEKDEEIKKLQARVKEQGKALKRYGEHETGCMKGDACNCGFNAAKGAE